MPKIVDKQQRRREIAASAIPLFADQGFENTPVREISAAAGIGKGTLYDYFKNKKEILAEIVELIFSEWQALVEKRIGGIQNPLDQLKHVLLEGVSMGARFEQALILYVDLWRRTVTGKESPAFVQNFGSYLRDSQENIRKIVVCAQNQGLIKSEIDPGQLALALISLIDGICLHAMVRKGRLAPDELAENIFKMLLEGIAA